MTPSPSSWKPSLAPALTGKTYKERQGKGLTWRYVLLDVTPETASILAGKAVMEDIEFIYQRHHEEGRSMFRVLDGDLKRLRELAAASNITVKEVW